MSNSGASLTPHPAAHQAAAQREPGRRTALLAVCAITALAALVRSVGLCDSLWLDELQTAWAVGGSWDDVAPRARMGNQSPLYYWGLWLLVQAAGLEEWVLRLPALLAGTALVPTVYAVLVCWTNSRATGLAGALLAAVDPVAVDYAQEARPYAWVMWIAVVHVACLARLTVAPRPLVRASFVGTFWLLFYLHYTAGLLWAADAAVQLVLFVLSAMRGKSATDHTAHLGGSTGRPAAHALRTMWLDLSLALAGTLPAWPHLADVAGRRHDWAQFVPAAGLVRLLTIYPIVGYLGVPACLLAVLAIARRWRGESIAVNGAGERLPRPALAPHSATYATPASPAAPDDREHAGLVVACWLLAPLAVAWLATWFDIARIFYRRYTLVSSLAPLMGAALLWSRAPTARTRAILLAAIVAVVQAGGGPLGELAHQGRIDRLVNEDWRGAIGQLRAALESSAEAPLAASPEVANAALLKAPPVLVAAGLIECEQGTIQSHAWARDYCLLPVGSIYPLGDPPVAPLACRRVPAIPSEVWAASQSAGQMWLLLRGDAAFARQCAAAVCAAAPGPEVLEISEVRPFRGVTLVRLQYESRPPR